jgi:hypothetical protein
LIAWTHQPGVLCGDRWIVERRAGVCIPSTAVEYRKSDRFFSENSNSDALSAASGGIIALSSVAIKF